MAHVFLQLFGTGGRTLVAPRIAGREGCGPGRRHRAPCASLGSGAGLVADVWPPGEVTPSLVESVAVPECGLGSRGLARRRTLHRRAQAPLTPRPDAKPQDAARIARR